jgi:hypothetical protein
MNPDLLNIDVGMIRRSATTAAEKEKTSADQAEQGGGRFRDNRVVQQQVVSTLRDGKHAVRIHGSGPQIERAV